MVPYYRSVGFGKRAKTPAPKQAPDWLPEPRYHSEQAALAQKKAAEQLPEQALDQAPGSEQEVPQKKAPEQLPEQASEWLPERTPEQPPEQLPEQASE